MRKVNNCKITTKFINEGVIYLMAGIIPDHYETEEEKRRFELRYEDMDRAGADLYFRNLRLIPRSRIDSVLRQVYTETGDIGRDRLYAYVKQKYAGISRRRVDLFLQHQELHQLRLPVRRQKINRSLVASRPMERWQVDLADMSKYKSPQNRQRTFLLTIIDCFSKFAWVKPLTNKRAATVAKALEQVFEEAGTPAVLQSDNGGEFLGEFDELLNSQGCVMPGAGRTILRQMVRSNGSTGRSRT